MMGLSQFPLPPSFLYVWVAWWIKWDEGVIDLCCDWKHNPLVPRKSPPTVWIIPSGGTWHRL